VPLVETETQSKMFSRSFNSQLLKKSSKRFFSLRLGDVAPNFTAATQLGSMDFHEYLGNSWGVLFSHPRDFTPVCTTELGEVERRLSEFASRNVKVMALSVDSVEEHFSWINDIVETQNISQISYPIIADTDRSISEFYGMLDQTNIAASGMPLTVRSVFIIGPDKQIKLIITYPASTGRNFDEVMRVIDSLQLTANHSVATPVNWKHGDDCVVVPSLSDEQATEKFGSFQKVKPYLRLTKQPNL